MNILHVIESSGGSADFVLYLVKYLPEHHHQIVYGDRTFGNRLKEVQTTYTNASFYYWKEVQREINIIKDFKATVHLYRILKNLSPHAIHLHSSKAGFIGRIVCFILRKRNVIYTPNGLAFLRKDVSTRKAVIYIWLEKLANFLNGKVVSCSKSEADALIDKGISSAYINNGTEIFNDDQLPIKPSNGPIIIATTGRVTIQKNPSLFQAIAKYFEGDSRYMFIWIGGGELEHLLTAKNISITGWVSHAEVNEKLREIDIYISMALWEGLPFAVLEAMNLNKPLLLSNCVGNIDLVRNGYNGFLFTSASEAIKKIKEILSDRKKLMEFGKNSKTLAQEQFDVKEMAKKYEIVYQHKD
jgi:glycosyltransferase involved in cell wall biosynthesis